MGCDSATSSCAAGQLAALPVADGTGDTGGPRGDSAPEPSWRPDIPSLRQHLPSLVWGAALPMGVHFVVRRHVHTNAEALIVAGGVSVAWVIVQLVLQRKVDVVGAVVLPGFAVGVVSSTLLGGNEYVFKVRVRRLYRSLRRHVNCDPVHARAPRPLLCQPLTVRGTRPRQGVRDS